MATITINIPEEQKDWLQSKSRNMTEILRQMVEEEMNKERLEGKVRFLPGNEDKTRKGPKRVSA